MSENKTAVDKLYELIDKGRSGLNIGISTGLTKLDSVISGIQKQTFYLIAGSTGAGKTSLCLYSFVYRPLMEHLGTDNFKVIYYSLEMTAEMLLAKLLSIYIWETFNIQLSYQQILSRLNILDDYNYGYILKAKDWLKQIEKQILIYDKKLTTNSLYAHLKAYAEANGIFEEQDHKVIYKPNNPDQILLVVGDHMGLMTPLAGQTKKQAMDLGAEYMFYFRNKCGWSMLPLQQLNRQNSSIDRRKENMQIPEIQDLKDTGGIAEAADVVLALHCPAKEKMSTWEGYNIKILKDKIRGICVLKNRFGESDKIVPAAFYGNINYFKDLPKSEEIIAKGNDYRPYIDLNFQEDLEEKNEDSSSQDSLFSL